MNLMALLQAVGSQQVPADAPPMGEDIVAQAPDPTIIPEDIRQAPSKEFNQELVQRKGMFGLKGTLRDILGLVGDGLLVGGGRQAIYRPVREREKLSDALLGFTQNPTAAAERVASIDPAMGQQLYDQTQDRQVQAQRYQQMAALQQLARQEQGVKRIGAFAKTLDSAEKWSRALPSLQKLYAAYGMDPSELPTDYNADFVADLYTRGIDPYRQETLAQGQQKIDQAGTNIESQIADRVARIGVANRNASTASQNAATNRQRAGETARHNRESERLSSERNAISKEGGKNGSLLSRIKIPPPPPGFSQKK